MYYRILFISDTGLPAVIMLRAVKVRNCSIILDWQLPPQPYEPITEFRVSFDIYLQLIILYACIMLYSC